MQGQVWSIRATGCQGSRRLSFHETFCLRTASKLLGIPHKSSLEWVWQRGEKPGSLRHPDQVPYIVTWKNLVEDSPPPMDKSLSFPKTHLTGSGCHEKLILQDPLPADPLLQDPPPPYPPTLAPMVPPAPALVSSYVTRAIEPLF